MAKATANTFTTKNITKGKYKDFAFDLWYNYMLKWEGGYVNHPQDPGGETNKGITLRTFKALANKFGYNPGDYNLFRKMPKELHRKIAREAFWNPVAKYLDFDCLTIYVVDFLWGSGYAPLKIQKYLNSKHKANITEDNKWGPQTAKALNNVAKKIGVKKLLKDLMAIRESYLLVELQPKFAVFYNGWKNRLLDVRKVFDKCFRIKKNANSLEH